MNTNDLTQQLPSPVEEEDDFDEKAMLIGIRDDLKTLLASVLKFNAKQEELDRNR